MPVLQEMVQDELGNQYADEETVHGVEPDDLQEVRDEDEDDDRHGYDLEDICFLAFPFRFFPEVVRVLIRRERVHPD
jgi:hypothetical protein